MSFNELCDAMASVQAHRQEPPCNKLGFYSKSRFVVQTVVGVKLGCSIGAAQNRNNAWEKPGDVDAYHISDHDTSLLQLKDRVAMRYMGCYFQWKRHDSGTRDETSYLVTRWYKLRDAVTDGVVDIEFSDVLFGDDVWSHFVACAGYDLAKIGRVVMLLDEYEPFIWEVAMRPGEYQARLVLYDEYGIREVKYGYTQMSRAAAMASLFERLQAETLFPLDMANYNALKVVRRW